jgi:hypothetical protein
MKRSILAIFLTGITLFAAFLGWYAQDIAYYYENHLLYQDPFKTLIIVTITSVGLFIISIVINTILLATQVKPRRIYIILLIANVFIGFFISLWSLFVLAMWWG